jgi:2-polyprenyl-3-methyl-5-hydroxy-6-metoxy-1,4-benzoquinol methylase
MNAGEDRQDFQKTQDFYREYFGRNERWEDNIERMATVVALFSQEPSGRCLEVGCGAGHVTAGLLNSCTEIVACDISMIEGMLQLAKSRDGLHIVRCSATNLPFREGSFETVVYSEVIEHLPAAVQRRSLDEIASCLRTSGRMILSTPNPESCRQKALDLAGKARGRGSRRGEQLVENWISPRELMRMLSPRFRIKKRLGSYYDVPVLDRSLARGLLRKMSQAMTKTGIFPGRGYYQYYVAVKREP